MIVRYVVVVDLSDMRYVGGCCMWMRSLISTTSFKMGDQCQLKNLIVMK